MKCVECGRESTPGDGWEVGWGCLFESLAVCSVACASKHAREHSKYHNIPAQELSIKYENDKGDEVWLTNEYDIQ